MNIWCISKYASPPKYSKMPARLFSLAKEFIQLGHNVNLITSDSNHFSNYPDKDTIYNYEVIENVPVCWIKTKKYQKTASIDRVLSWFDFERKLFKLDLTKVTKPDVVIVSSLSIFSIIYGYFLKKKFNAFLVFEIRDIWPLTMTEEGGFSKWHPLVLLIGFIEKFGYKKADLVVGTMPKLDLHLEDIIGYKKNFFCSPLGFNENDYEEEKSSINNPFDAVVPSDKIIVGYAGSMGVTNALDTFIESIKILNSNDKIHFVLVGSGDLKESFKSELNKCNNVTFLDRIEQKMVKFFLKKCDILYLSTKDSKVWDFGQSMNKVVEYMLSSKPIIASYSGYPSMINEAKCGYFVDHSSADDLANKILDIATLSEEKRLQQGMNGKNWIYENRTYSKLAQLYIMEIERLIGKGKND